MFILHYIIPLIIFYFFKNLFKIFGARKTIKVFSGYRDRIMLWGLLVANLIDLDHIYCSVFVVTVINSWGYIFLEIARKIQSTISWILGVYLLKLTRGGITYSFAIVYNDYDVSGLLLSSYNLTLI